MSYPCESRHEGCQFAKCISEYPLKVKIRESEGEPNISVNGYPAIRAEKILEIECAFYECPQNKGG